MREANTGFSTWFDSVSDFGSWFSRNLSAECTDAGDIYVWLIKKRYQADRDLHHSINIKWFWVRFNMLALRKELTPILEKMTQEQYIKLYNIQKSKDIDTRKLKTDVDKAIFQSEVVEHVFHSILAHIEARVRPWILITWDVPGYELESYEKKVPIQVIEIFTKPNLCKLVIGRVKALVSA